MILGWPSNVAAITIQSALGMRIKFTLSVLWFKLQDQTFELQDGGSNMADEISEINGST